MMIRYCLLRLVLAVMLLGWKESWAQTTAVPGADSTLKGRIWTATASRIWADIKPAKQKQPAAWATDEDFKTWRDKNPNDKSGVGLLWGDVVKQVRTTQPASLKGQPAAPTQVAQAILTEIERKQARDKAWDKAWDRINVAALRGDLQKIVPLTGAPPPAASSTTPVVTTPAAPGTTAVPVTPLRPTANQNTLPADSVESSLPLQETATTSDSFIHQHPEQAMLGAGILGLILGAVLMAMLRGKSSSSGRRSRRSEDGLATPNYAGQADYLSEQELYWRNQNTELRRKIVELDRKITTLEAAAAPVALVTPEAIPSLIILPSPEEIADLELEVPLAPEVGPEPPAPPTPRYGPVQETPFIEERKIVDTPLPQLALMLTPDPQNPDRASFTLNPQVNQTMLIGDGLTRLQKFFDYDPPVGRITTVAAAEAGQLQRQADGWQVVERARLLIR